MSLKFILTILCSLAASAAWAQHDALVRADSLASEFEYSAAVEAYRSAEPVDSYRRLNGLSTAENMLGLDLLAEGNRDGAEAHFSRAIDTAERFTQEYPDSADSHFDLAAAYGNLALLKGGKTKVRLGRQVEEQALRAIEIDSTHSDALSVLGVFYREVSQLSWIERFVANSLFGGIPSGGLEKSETYLRKALEADPASAFAAFELGQTLIEQGRDHEAREIYRQLLTMTPRNSENVRNMEEAKRWLEASQDD